MLGDLTHGLDHGAATDSGPWSSCRCDKAVNRVRRSTRAPMAPRPTGKDHIAFPVIGLPPTRSAAWLAASIPVRQSSGARNTEKRTVPRAAACGSPEKQTH